MLMSQFMKKVAFSSLFFAFFYAEAPLLVDRLLPEAFEFTTFLKEFAHSTTINGAEICDTRGFDWTKALGKPWGELWGQLFHKRYERSRLQARMAAQASLGTN